MEPTKCQKCNDGTLIPLSDPGQEGASVILTLIAQTVSRVPTIEVVAVRPLLRREVLPRNSVLVCSVGAQ